MRNTFRNQNGALAASLVVSSQKARLQSLTITNTKGSAQYVQIHDAAAVPAEASVPIWIYYMPASTSVHILFPDGGLPCSTGITVCNSSTAATKTIGSADCHFTGVTGEF